MEWISVEDRLPYDEHLVLIYIQGFSHVSGPDMIGLGEWHEFEDSSLSFWSSCSLGGECDEIRDEKITYWMPLPSAPVSIPKMSCQSENK